MTAKDLVHELADPACYSHAPGDVQIVQTHLSVVCLAGDLAYKLKKALVLPFVDFSTLAARRHTCREEVRLNRRLCRDTYLGTAALRRLAGQLRFAAIGDDSGDDDIDVAVVMRRLPADRMLDELLRHQRVGEPEIAQLAALVAGFHATAERSASVRAAGDPRQLATFAAANFSELEVIPAHGLPAALLNRLAAASADDFARLLPLLERRAAAGRVVDGHGDLHARNICMTTPPTIYDCLEFAPAFRCGDVATEVAFLAMDLRYRSALALARSFVESYVANSGDQELPLLLPPLCSYRAMVRAKVAALAANQQELAAADREGARHSAFDHLVLAAAYATETRGPWWLVFSGPPASGKSRLRARLAALTQWPHIATDELRKELAGIPSTTKARPEHYTAEFTQHTYDTLSARAAALTRNCEPVVLLDGNFPTPAHRKAAATAAGASGARLLVAHVDIDAATAVARARARATEPGNVSDAGPELTAALCARYVPPAEEEGLTVVRCRGERNTDDLVIDVLVSMLDGVRTH